MSYEPGNDPVFQAFMRWIKIRERLVKLARASEATARLSQELRRTDDAPDHGLGCRLKRGKK